MYCFGVPWRLAYQRHEHSPVKRIPTAIDLAMNMRAHLVQLRTTFTDTENGAIHKFMLKCVQ